MYRNRIEGLEVRSSTFRAALRIERSEISSVSIHDADASGHLIVEYNRADIVDIRRSKFRSTPYVNYNTITGNLELASISLHLRPESFDPEVAVNKIGGQLWYMPEVLNQVRRVDLTLNAVARLATVYPPEDWTGMIDLSNSKIGSRLKLGDFKRYAEPPDEPAGQADEGDEVWLPPYAPNPRGYSCSQSGIPPSILVNLTNVETDVLAWNFPLSCAVQWDGAGLRYRYWGDPDLKPTGIVVASHDAEAVTGSALAAAPSAQGPGRHRDEGDFGAAFKEWRHMLYERSSGPLSVMAEYLHERGDFSGSRALLRDAKATDYAGQWLVYYMLWPTGFGAKPERALYWLFVLWLIGIAIYWFYLRYAAGAGWPPKDAEAKPRSAGAVHRSRSGKEAPAEQPSLGPGFMQYQRDKRPADFSLAVFSADALLPVLNLHAYTEYYPRSRPLRFFTFVQHVAGWYLLTIFLASATVL
jgi:hypothetical protein